MLHKENKYKKCCLNCEYWGVQSGIFWNTNGYCYRRYGAITKANFKCGHFEYTKALLKEIENNKTDRYKQALRDIENIIRNFCNSCNPELECAECTDREILDIISKIIKQGV